MEKTLPLSSRPTYVKHNETRVCERARGRKSARHILIEKLCKLYLGDAGELAAEAIENLPQETTLSTRVGDNRRHRKHGCGRARQAGRRGAPERSCAFAKHFRSTG
jgi:hypothetical protein